MKGNSLLPAVAAILILAAGLTRAQEWAEKLDNPFYSGMAFREIGSAYLLSFNKFLDFHKLVLYIIDPLRPGLYRGHTRAFFPDGVRIAFS